MGVRRIVVASLLSAGAIAATIGPLASTAAAMPITQNTIKAECSQAGGAYQWWGGGSSTCTYRDNEGTLYRDYYLNGVYTRTD